MSSRGIRALLILGAVCLPACSARLTPPADIPPASSAAHLDPQVRQACDPIPQVTDGSAIGIASADSDLALSARKCSAKHDAAVSSFDELAAAYQELRDAITKGVKGNKHGK